MDDRVTVLYRSFLSVAALFLLIACSIGVCAKAMAATQAGIVIKNQASASYKDTRGVKRIATSNVVETVVQQVAAIELSFSQNKPSTSGQQIYFAHTIVNSGNGPDRVNLSATSTGSGDFYFDNVAIYTDDNRNGAPDSFSPITASHLLSPGESQSIVVGATVPASILNGSNGELNIQAQSQFDNSITDSNTDNTVVTDTAVISVTSQISALQGSSPSGPFTVTMFYRNNSEADATQVTLLDALPDGMRYVTNSGRWSESGATSMTDADSGDNQSGISYCAYDTTCSGLPEANADLDSLSTNQVTAIIASVKAGKHGHVQFQVLIENDYPTSYVYNNAELFYSSNGVQTGPIQSNSVPFQILRGSAVVINGSGVSSVDGAGEPLVISDNVAGTNSNHPECVLSSSDPDGDGYGIENDTQCIMPGPHAGNAVFYKNTVWNTGNSTDTYDLLTQSSTFPAGTLINLLQADGQTPLVDTSNNGIVDTGPIAPGEAREIVMQVVLPSGTSGNNSGSNFNITTVAVSVNDAAATNSMINTLLNIAAGSIDITNSSALGHSAATGIGSGPESAPVSSFTVTPGGTAIVDLYINNTSDIAMDFDLSASIHADFSSVELPDFWQLEFMLDDNVVTSNTGLIEAGDHVLVKASITVPENSSPSTVSVYFKATNDISSVSDIKHDEIIVAAKQAVLMGVDQQGQAQAGATRVYSHLLENNGTIDLVNIDLSLDDSLADSGWSSILFEDTDGDEILTPADQQVTSTQLPAGMKKTLYIKVFAPANAGSGQSNITTLIATWGTESLRVSNITSIGEGNISVRKEQALDDGCDGFLDSAYSSSAFAVKPGNNCVRYRLTAFNASTYEALNVLVADATPTFTSYMGNAVCSHSVCTIVEPPLGGQGEITASLAQLQAGDSLVVEFLVRID